MHLLKSEMPKEESSMTERLEWAMSRMGCRCYMDFIKKTGIRRSTFYNMMNNKRNIQTKTVLKLSDAGINIAWLLSGSGNPFNRKAELVTLKRAIPPQTATMTNFHNQNGHTVSQPEPSYHVADNSRHSQNERASATPVSLDEEILGSPKFARLVPCACGRGYVLSSQEIMMISRGKLSLARRRRMRQSLPPSSGATLPTRASDPLWKVWLQALARIKFLKG